STSSTLLWHRFDDPLCVGEAGSDVIHRQPWIIGEELREVRIVREILKHELDRNPSPFDHRLTAQACGICDDAVRAYCMFYRHRAQQARPRISMVKTTLTRGLLRSLHNPLPLSPIPPTLPR